MARVRLRVAYRRRGGPSGRAGQVVDLDDAAAARLTTAGRAVALADDGTDPEPEPAPKPKRSRRKPADDAFLNPDIAVTGNRSRR